MALAVINCCSCGYHLTRPLERLGELPEPQRCGGTGYRATLPAGSWAVGPSPEENLVVNPDDASDLERHPDPLRSSGCCGHDGLDGPNRRCPSCHADVAILRDDCWTVVELQFQPASVDVTLTL